MDPSLSDAPAALYLSLGSNLGDREANLRKAVSLLEKRWNTSCEACSDLVETEPWGRWAETPSPFLNAAAAFLLPMRPTPENALRLLADCKEVERQLGRKESLEYAPDGERLYRPRTIDIDLLLWGTLKVNLPALQLPHPRMGERDFVLRPLGQIADIRKILSIFADSPRQR